MISTSALASALVPTPSATLLLQAALQDPDEAATAFGRWLSNEPEPTRALAQPETVSLAATLFLMLDNKGVEVPDRRLATYLKTAVLHEELRRDAYLAALDELLGELLKDGVRFLLGAGALAGLTLYPDGLRHSHDIDLMVHPEDQSKVSALLADSGYSRRQREFVHSSGLPICLHQRALAFRSHSLSLGTLFDRAVTCDLLGHSVRVPAPEDRFLQACVNGVCGNRRGVLWVLDAMLLAEAHELHLSRVIATARSAACSLELHIATDYLQSQIAPGMASCSLVVYEQDRIGLQTQAACSGMKARETLLQVSWSGSHGSLRQHFERCRSPLERLFLLKARLLPSTAALRSSNRISAASELPQFYLGRLRRSTARARRALSRTPSP